MKIKYLLFVCVVISSFSACHKVEVEPGFEAVLYDQPYFWGKGGVKDEAVKPGLKWVWTTTNSILVDVRPLQMSEIFDDMISDDNIPVDFNAYAKMRILNPVNLIDGFGSKWYENNVKESFRTIIRSICKSYTMTQLTSDEKIIALMQDKAKSLLSAHIKTNNIPILIMDVIIGKISPNEAVKIAIDQTAAQQQLQKTEKERALAQEQRKLSEEKRAEADNAYRKMLGLSPELFVDLEKIKSFQVSAEACSKSANCMLVITSSDKQLVLPNKR